MENLSTKKIIQKFETLPEFDKKELFEFIVEKNEKRRFF